MHYLSFNVYTIEIKISYAMNDNQEIRYCLNDLQPALMHNYQPQVCQQRCVQVVLNDRSK